MENRELVHWSRANRALTLNMPVLKLDIEKRAMVKDISNCVAQKRFPYEINRVGLRTRVNESLFACTGDNQGANLRQIPVKQQYVGH
jgi:hypothetical protein